MTYTKAAVAHPRSLPSTYVAGGRRTPQRIGSSMEKIQGRGFGGTLTRYGGGLWRKKRLLELEHEAGRTRSG
ncbi:MAG: hypothetical protein L7S64_10610 [Longimicrobiales bacterium]|nr:hypothetical protein [Longimicrobiales bacterium]